VQLQGLGKLGGGGGNNSLNSLGLKPATFWLVVPELLGYCMPLFLFSNNLN
jgi:hypothetical protein